VTNAIFVLVFILVSIMAV